MLLTFFDGCLCLSAGTSGATRNDWATRGDGTEGEFDHTAGLRAPADLYDGSA